MARPQRVGVSLFGIVGVLALVAGVSLFGDNMRRLFGISADALSGDTSANSSTMSRATLPPAA